MGTWRMPYSIPRFTNEEFEKMRADYIAKYGYTVYVPGWDDIIHLPLEESFTDQEEIHWGAKDWDFFTPERLATLKSIKAMRKKAYQRLLGSPQPRILRNRGSLLTAIDNNQDALSTLSMIIRIAMPLLPRVFQRLMTGPVGWIMTINDILNLCSYAMTPERSALRTKRIKDAITDKNPFSTKARYKRAMKIYNTTLTKGNLIEALQTTDQVFGYGISLGAVMNLPFDMAFGFVRTLEGQKVTITKPISKPIKWVSRASLAWKSLTTLYTTEGVLGLIDHAPMLILSHMVSVAMQAAMPVLDPLNIVHVDEGYEVEALQPKKSYLKEVMQEEGDDPEKFTGWPLTNTRWASCTRIASEGAAVASKTFKRYCDDNRYSMEGFYCATRASEGALYALSATSKGGGVELDYLATEKITHAILDAGYRLPWYLWGRYQYWPEYQNAKVEDFSEEIREYVKERLKLYEGLTPQMIRYKYRFQKLPEPLFNQGHDWRDIHTTYQYAKYFTTADLYYIDIIPRGTLFSAVWTAIIKYLTDYEEIGETPTTPEFIRFLKERCGVVLPKCETADEGQDWNMHFGAKQSPF